MTISRARVLLLLLCWSVTPASAAPPDSPTNVSPPDGALSVPANPLLCVEASDPDGDLLRVQFLGRDLTAIPSVDFTLIVLPDTQYYSLFHPQIFDTQAQWIVSNRETKNIAFVSHVGDCVNNPESEFEWNIADHAMRFLEDPVTTALPDGVPYGIAPGNHDNDFNPGSLEDQVGGSQLYNQFFGVQRFVDRAYYGGHFGTNNDNHYELFSASGMDFISIHLEFDPFPGPLQTAVLEWADDLLTTYDDRRAILTAHYIIDQDGAFGLQGQSIYDALKDNPNLFLMLCGHLWWNPRRSDTHDGNTIHSLMSNYQHSPPFGGNGWLRVMTFSPSRNEIQVETYSPWLDDFLASSNDQFVLEYDMDDGIPFQSIEVADEISSGTSACVSWPGRRDGAQYAWFVRISDDSGTTTGPTSTFTSMGACNSAHDCDDGDPCTTDNCDSTSCTHAPLLNCCTDDTACGDGNPCTDDSCESGSCRFEINTDPCTDGIPCTVNDTCEGGNCLGVELDCDDTNSCTADSCSEGRCENLYIPLHGCCATDADCDDLNACTADGCDGGSCTNVPTLDCCADDGSCSDGDICTEDVCGRNQASVRLDGPGAHVTMGNTGTQNMDNHALNASEFTIEAWFKWDGGGETLVTSSVDEDAPGIEAYPLIAKGRDAPDVDLDWHINYFLGIHAPDNVLAADFEEHESGTTPGANHPVVGTTPVGTGVWHHAAATYDGSCWQLYLDGQPETDGTNCPGEPPNFESDNFFSLGTGQTNTGSAAGSFTGGLDEARVWTRARSQSEIQAGMNSEIEFAPGLIGRWGLEEGSGFVAADTSGNANDGIVVGATWDWLDLPLLGSNSCEFRSVPEVSGVLLGNQGGITTLFWDYGGPGTGYDAASGSVSSLQEQSGAFSAGCLLDDGIDTGLTDKRPAPVVGGGYYYLVRTERACSGSYGKSSAGIERLPASPCP